MPRSDVQGRGRSQVPSSDVRGRGYPTYPMMHMMYLPSVGIKKPCLCLYELELINSSSPPATNSSKEINIIVYNAAVLVLNFVIKIFVSVNLGEIIF